jgi:hypothetical protein
MCNAFDDPQHARTSDAGIYLMEIPYKAIRADALSLYGKNAVISSTKRFRILNQASLSVKL